MCNITKYFIKGTSKEVKLGEPFYYSSKNKLYYANFFIDTLTEEELNILLNLGIIEVRKAPKPIEVPTKVTYYIDKVGSKFGLSSNDSKIVAKELFKYSPSCLFSLLSKQIAFELDKKYSDHIKDSKKIYAISLINGKITEVDKTTIKSYKNFAAFRSIEDATFACNILNVVLDRMFANDSK